MDSIERERKLDAIDNYCKTRHSCSSCDISRFCSLCVSPDNRFITNDNMLTSAYLNITEGCPCEGCKYYDEKYDEFCKGCCYGVFDDSVTDILFEPTEEKDATVEDKQEPTGDNKEDVINHPSHYCNGGMECIDEMILIFGKHAVMNFCACNAWKYRYRAPYKNGDEDRKKADWYMAKYKELSESVGTEKTNRI